MAPLALAAGWGRGIRGAHGGGAIHHWSASPYPCCWLGARVGGEGHTGAVRLTLEVPPLTLAAGWGRGWGAHGGGGTHPWSASPCPCCWLGAGVRGTRGQRDSPLKCLPLPLLLAGGGGEGHTGAAGLTLEVPPLALAAGWGRGWGAHGGSGTHPWSASPCPCCWLGAGVRGTRGQWDSPLKCLPLPLLLAFECDLPRDGWLSLCPLCDESRRDDPPWEPHLMRPTLSVTLPISVWRTRSRRGQRALYVYLTVKWPIYVMQELLKRSDGPKPVYQTNCLN